MKVALEAGEVLDVAIIDGDKVVGHLSLQLKGITGSSAPRVGRPAGSSAKASSSDDQGVPGRRRKRKPMSAETRARMAEAQRRRWENKKPEESTPSN